ncbi:peroxidase family protein, partial [Verrucomicrobiales bacterium]|nr:peroxidase family protein [Verrucomicrobiales bacterium]
MKFIAPVAAAALITSAYGETAFSRWAPPAYADGVSAPAGTDRPNARTISNALSAQESPSPDPRRLSDFVWQWGQFIDHDLVLTHTDPSEPFPIAVTDEGDLLAPAIPFSRSENDGGDPREQINSVTPSLDASMVYGSTPERTAALRTFDGGRLRTSAGDLLPYNTTGLDNDSGGAPESEAASFFVGGDLRVNEQPGLTAMHTLFVREHNRIADSLAATHP